MAQQVAGKSRHLFFRVHIFLSRGLVFYSGSSQHIVYAHRITPGRVIYKHMGTSMIPTL